MSLVACAQDVSTGAPGAAQAYFQPLTRTASRPDYSASASLPPIELVSMHHGAMAGQPVITTDAVDGQPWIAPAANGPMFETTPLVSDDGDWISSQPGGPEFYGPGPPAYWTWQLLPDTIIYHSYMAGVHEPRFSVVMFDMLSDGRDLWDATLGGRVGVLRYGDTNCLRPQGWQLDFEGAAIMRFTLDYERDFETADYRAGVPITYGIGDWQFKFGYYHLSSHMGDEHAIREDAIDERINYVRDAMLLGASYYPYPYMRVYGEVGYAFNALGGAEPWEFQFGTELAQPGPTGLRGTPFFAANAHLRQEQNYGGDITTQLGWLWRGRENQTLRMGLHYFNGKSSQYETFDDSEEQIGFGVWYDF